MVLLDANWHKMCKLCSGSAKPGIGPRGLYARLLRFVTLCNMKQVLVAMGDDLQPGCLADRLVAGLSQPEINP
eukprot:1149058-Pelagomonas_calceolata.AAC.10